MNFCEKINEGLNSGIAKDISGPYFDGLYYTYQVTYLAASDLNKIAELSEDDVVKMVLNDNLNRRQNRPRLEYLVTKCGSTEFKYEEIGPFYIYFEIVPDGIMVTRVLIQGEHFNLDTISGFENVDFSMLDSTFFIAEELQSRNLISTVKSDPSNISMKIIKEDNNGQNLKGGSKSSYLKWIKIFKFQSWVATSYFLAGGALLFAIFSWGEELHQESFVDYLPQFLIGAIGALAIYAFATFFIRQRNHKKIEEIERSLSQNANNLAISRLTESEDDFYARLIQINFTHLNEYYLQTQIQAKNSFNLATFAAVVGFMTLLIGIFRFKGMPSGSENIPLITVIAGVLSEFIAAIFFYLYTQTVQKMSQYHENLLKTQNINLALKIARELEGEDKVKALSTIVDRLTMLSKSIQLDTAPKVITSEAIKE